MKIGLSPLTNTIFIGNTRKNKTSEVWIKKEDITDDAVRCVFEWLKVNALESGKRYYTINYASESCTMLLDLGESYNLKLEKNLDEDTR
jgi:hypothetical protein